MLHQNNNHKSPILQKIFIHYFRYNTSKNAYKTKRKRKKGNKRKNKKRSEKQTKQHV